MKGSEVLRYRTMITTPGRQDREEGLVPDKNPFGTPEIMIRTILPMNFWKYGSKGINVGLKNPVCGGSAAFATKSEQGFLIPGEIINIKRGSIFIGIENVLACCTQIILFDWMTASDVEKEVKGDCFQVLFPGK